MATITISLTAFSQIDTNKICFPKITAKKIAKDLLAYDSLKYEHYYLKSNYDLLYATSLNKDSIILLKDSSIKVFKLKVYELNSIIRYRDSQISEYKYIVNETNKDLEKETRKNSLLKKGIIASIILIIFAYITN